MQKSKHGYYRSNWWQSQKGGIHKFERRAIFGRTVLPPFRSILKFVLMSVSIHKSLNNKSGIYAQRNTRTLQKYDISRKKVKLYTQKRTGDKYGTSQHQSASLVFPLVRTSGNFDKQISKNICLIITAI